MKLVVIGASPPALQYTIVADAKRRCIYALIR